MAEFTLDTSGAVHAPDYPPPNGVEHWHWHYLDAFTQGYVEALFASLPRFGEAGFPMLEFADHSGHLPVKFSDLAPETLAAILKDCAAWLAAYGRMYRVEPTSRDRGDSFWSGRQQGAYPRFPPLTVTLGDDGKVYLRENG